MIASTRSSSVASSSASTPACAERRAQLLLARARRLREALAEAAVVRVDEQLLAGLGVLHHEQPEVGQLQLQRIVEAHGDHFVALREVRERLAPSPGVLMKSETTNTSERRCITWNAALQEARRGRSPRDCVALGPRRACGAGCAARGARPLRARDDRVDARRRRTARRRGCRGA